MTAATPVEICAVITTFRPEAGFPDRVARTLSQVGGVIIVDDGASAENVSQLAGWFAGVPGVVLLHNPGNLGVAAALNRGLEQARAGGFRFALLLDDDSSLAPGIVEHLLAAYAACPEPSLLGIGYGRSSGSEGQGLRPVTSLITAGTLLPLELYRRIGPFREDLFIDYVDHEYALRARALGVRLFLSQRLGMEQPIGETRQAAGLTLKSVHSPVRTYYFFRNASVVLSEYFVRFPRFSLWILWQQVKTAVKIILFLDGKPRYLKAMVQGWADHWRGRLGRIPENLKL
jgi:rhamnosyltransferase